MSVESEGREPDQRYRDPIAPRDIFGLSYFRIFQAWAVECSPERSAMTITSTTLVAASIPERWWQPQFQSHHDWVPSGGWRPQLYIATRLLWGFVQAVFIEPPSYWCRMVSIFNLSSNKSGVLRDVGLPSGVDITCYLCDQKCQNARGVRKVYIWPAKLAKKDSSRA